jgi:bifunctional ADP-heptose synthase (sugar kinase/adenylyltransferase)
LSHETASSFPASGPIRAAPGIEAPVAGGGRCDARPIHLGRVRRISPEAPCRSSSFNRRTSWRGRGQRGLQPYRAGRAGVALTVSSARTPRRRTWRRSWDGAESIAGGLMAVEDRPTGLKTRVIAHQQHVVGSIASVGDRWGRPTRNGSSSRWFRAARCRRRARGDYAKGWCRRGLLDVLKAECRRRAIWLSVDPKPFNRLDLEGLSLVTPNRRRRSNWRGWRTTCTPAIRWRTVPDERGRRPAGAASAGVAPDHAGVPGMLLCRREAAVSHTHRGARGVRRVGAGDTVLASFTLAIAAGASPSRRRPLRITRRAWWW